MSFTAFSPTSFWAHWASLASGAVTVIGLLQAGAIDMAADKPHSPAVYRLIEWAREQSIARRAADILPPVDLSDAGRIRRGAGNYGAMCANCHLSPGIEDSEIRKGLYPTPPVLDHQTRRQGVRHAGLVERRHGK